jgi:hypothetical protein
MSIVEWKKYEILTDETNQHWFQVWVNLSKSFIKNINAKLTKQQVLEIETLAAVLSVEQMADYFGIGKTTF